MIATENTETTIVQGEEVPPVKAGLSPAEEAAGKFTRLLPFVKKIAAASEGKKSLVRVIHALAEFPLGSGKPRLLNDNERQLFQILIDLQQQKSIILTELIKNQNVPNKESEQSLQDLPTDKETDY